MLSIKLALLSVCVLLLNFSSSAHIVTDIVTIYSD